jgi:hypothetical protein
MSSNKNAEKFNWAQGFTIDFDLKSGLSKSGAESSKPNMTASGRYWLRGNWSGLFVKSASTS